MATLPRRVRWGCSVAGFLLGLGGVLWWQQEQDRQMLERMPPPDSPSDRTTDQRGE